MGLDMYLEKHYYIKNWDHSPLERKTEITVLRGGQPVKGITSENVKYVITEVAYWRKANQIHNWFVKNIQGGKDDCHEYYVPKEKLTELLNLSKQVLVLIEAGNKAGAAELLPTQNGFFFGSTEYDEWYVEDIKDTVNQLTKELADDDGEANCYYRSSW